MLAVKYDAMLVIIDVRRILESPELTADFNRNNSVVLACREIKPSCIALAFGAKRTCGIPRFCCREKLCNVLRVLFRLCEIYSNVNLSVLGVNRPFNVARDAVTSDIVRII